MIETCALNYCQDGISVYFGNENMKYDYKAIYGQYELQTGELNGRPYFQMEPFGFWWDGIKRWWIGLDSWKGLPYGYAYYTKDAFCPHQLSEFKWFLFDGFSFWIGKFDLRISCKHNLIKYSESWNTGDSLMWFH